MKTTLAVLTVALLSASASAFAGDAKSEITAQTRAWAAACNAHDVAKLVTLYDAEPKFIYAFMGQEGSGKAALEGFWKQSFQMTPDIAVTLQSYDVVQTSPNTAMGMGLWEDTFTGPDGKKITAQVQTSEVYVKVNGQWKIRVDHASFVPPPQPPK